MCQQQDCLSLVGAVGSLLGRAIAACAASDAGKGQELQGTVLLELEQLKEEPRSDLIIRGTSVATAQSVRCRSPA